MSIKKVVSFVNPNFQQGPKEFNAYYLPYSAGVLWSYVIQDSTINSNYEIGEFIWRRDLIEDAVERLKDGTISNYRYDRGTASISSND